MPCALRRKVPGCVPDVRIEVSRAAWSKHWRQCVWLTCLTPTRATLASRCSKRTARHAATTAEMWDGRPREKYILWFVIVRASAIWNLVARHISRWSVRASERSNVLTRTGPAVWKVRRASRPALMSRAALTPSLPLSHFSSVPPSFLHSLRLSLSLSPSLPPSLPPLPPSLSLSLSLSNNTLAWQWPSLGDAACQIRKMSTLLNELFFVFKISLLPNTRVKYYIVNWCSGLACNWCSGWYSVIPSTPDFPAEYQIHRHSNPARLPTFAAIWGPVLVLAPQIKQIRITLMTMFKVNLAPATPNDVGLR